MYSGGARLNRDETARGAKEIHDDHTPINLITLCGFSLSRKSEIRRGKGMLGALLKLYNTS